jgi:NADH-quinone oxidoreductase subunit I
MNGLGIINGLWITFQHFLESYLEDLKSGKKRYYHDEGIQNRMSSKTRGIFTVQYPEEKLPVPEEFRFIPILIYDEVDGQKLLRCTACGICAKVCPPQCIWIVRKTDPDTGRPLTSPLEYSIDVDLCMNCGMCAEYCPFDAIKMDHDYELSTVDRFKDNIFHINRLAKSSTYYAAIRPSNYAKEEAIRAEKKAAKSEKATSE